MAARACAGGQICVRLHNSEGVVVSLNGDVGLTRGCRGGRFGERALVNRVARATKAAFGTQTGLCRRSNRSLFASRNRAAFLPFSLGVGLLSQFFGGLADSFGARRMLVAGAA
jgi:hypothetical protein